MSAPIVEIQGFDYDIPVISLEIPEVRVESLPKFGSINEYDDLIVSFSLEDPRFYETMYQWLLDYTNSQNEPSYNDDETREINIHFYNDKDDCVLTYSFYDCYPSKISSVYVSAKEEKDPSSVEVGCDSDRAFHVFFSFDSFDVEAFYPEDDDEGEEEEEEVDVEAGEVSTTEVE